MKTYHNGILGIQATKPPTPKRTHSTVHVFAAETTPSQTPVNPLNHSNLLSFLKSKCQPLLPPPSQSTKIQPLFPPEQPPSSVPARQFFEPWILLFLDGLVPPTHFWIFKPFQKGKHIFETSKY
jgi:hypothetical protein